MSFFRAPENLRVWIHRRPPFVVLRDGIAPAGPLAAKSPGDPTLRIPLDPASPPPDDCSTLSPANPLAVPFVYMLITAVSSQAKHFEVKSESVGTAISVPPTMGRSRATPPSPISFDKSTALRQNSFGSDSSDKDKVSQHRSLRSSTASSNSSDMKNFARSTSGSWISDHLKRSSTQGNSKPSSPTVNVHTYCGRHTDQYLFGGRSMSDFMRSMTKKQ
ncbi:hypothetical protein F5Y19DRAFT_469808 [Xylariaceae sp. FL1651]|nr:hypothetical protein F5Y19DRAFT_469808 [Xylariaceae sp. FL1651]